MSKYDRLDSLFEGFENRIAIGDLEDKVKAALMKKLGEDFTLSGPGKKVLEDEMGTVYFDIDTLEVENDGSAETIADLLGITPDEFAAKIKGELEKMPATDLGKYESNVQESTGRFLYGMKTFESFQATEVVNESEIPEELKNVKQIAAITEDKYDDMHGVLPPIYISSIDDIKVGGFAVSEPYDSFKGLPTFGVYFKFKGKYYSAVASLTKADGKPITFASYNNQEFTRNNKATSVEKENRE